MADTLISVINEVLTATGQRANKTSIVETDSTAFLRDRINDALEELYDLKPFEIDNAGSVTLTASTRTVNPPTGLDAYRIYTWSYRINKTTGDIPLQFVTEQFIVENFPLFESDEAEYPEYVYLSQNKLAFYPLLETGASSLTIQFIYPAQFTKLTSTSAVFPFQDRSQEMRFIKLVAQRDYELFKGLGQPGVTQSQIDMVKSRLIAKYRKAKRMAFSGHRKFK